MWWDNVSVLGVVNSYGITSGVTTFCCISLGSFSLKFLALACKCISFTLSIEFRGSGVLLTLKTVARHERAMSAVPAASVPSYLVELFSPRRMLIAKPATSLIR